MLLINEDPPKLTASTIDLRYRSPLESLTGDDVINHFEQKGENVFIYNLPPLTVDDIRGRDTALALNVFKLHTQTDSYIFGKKPDSYEKFEKAIRQRIEKSDISLAQHIDLVFIYERVFEDLKQIERIRKECSIILLGEELKHQPFRSHLVTEFGGMFPHIDDTFMTFSAQYGPLTTKQVTPEGEIPLPAPSFACWMGTDGVKMLDCTPKERISLLLQHCAPGRTEAEKNQKRLSFILPLYETRLEIY